MSALLQQAIASLNLQPGQTYRTTVNGHDVEVRVKKSADNESSDYTDMEMLRPWFTIPDPRPVKTLTVRRCVPSLPAPYELDETDLAPE